MKFLGGVRQRLGGFYNFPVVLFFPVLDMSNSNLLPVQSVSGMFTCPLPVLFLGAGSPFRKSWNAGEQCTPWLKEGKGLFDKNKFIQFSVTTRCSHHSSCQILVTELVPAFQRDRSPTTKEAHERSILIMGLVFGEGRYVLENALNCNASLCKHMAQSPHMSPGVISVGRGVTLLQES